MNPQPIQSVSTIGSAPKQCRGTGCGHAHVQSVQVTVARLPCYQPWQQLQAVQCPYRHPWCHARWDTDPGFWPATPASAKQLHCFNADASGDICIHGSTMAQLREHPPWHQLNSHIVSLQTCLVTFAYMAAQWPSFVGSKGSSSLCSQQAWPQGPRSLWDWLVQWNTCRRFDDDYLVLWGARYH